MHSGTPSTMEPYNTIKPMTTKNNYNFEDKLNPLISQGKMSLANATKLDVTDDELDGYIAYRIRNHMQRGVDPTTMATVFYADANYIYDSMRPFFPDITIERVQCIVAKMERHGYFVRHNALWYSVKVPMANMPLV